MLHEHLCWFRRWVDLSAHRTLTSFVVPVTVNAVESEAFGARAKARVVFRAVAISCIVARRAQPQQVERPVPGFRSSRAALCRSHAAASRRCARVCLERL